MKRLTGAFLFGVATLLVVFPFAALGGADSQSVVIKAAKQGLVSDRIIGGMFAEDQGFWSSVVASIPAAPVMPLALGFKISRPPFLGDGGTTPPWWVPPRRPPWGSPYR